jgi:hypothetical protein
VQIALWTSAIGLVVFFYGLIRLEVPAIPTTLLVLMGLSLATGGVSFLAPPPRSTVSGDKENFPERAEPRTAIEPANRAGATELGSVPSATNVKTASENTELPGSATMTPISPKVVPKLSDLIQNFPSSGPPQLSLSRAQMLFWTVIAVILFVAKSALEGELWPVPWELVGLMGISQLGYLVPKFYGPGAGGT